MTKNDLFHDYNLILKMKVPIEIKEGMLTQLFRADTNRWRVIGITHAALLRFKEYGFRKISGIKIQRAHIKDRTDIYREMLSKEFADCNEWWEFYFTNDETILATSSENKKGSFSEVIRTNKDLELFKSRGFSWVHNKTERKHLQDLYTKYFAGSQLIP